MNWRAVFNHFMGELRAFIAARHDRPVGKLPEAMQTVIHDNGPGNLHIDAKACRDADHMRAFFAHGGR